MITRSFRPTSCFFLWLLVLTLTFAAIGCFNRLGQDAEVFDKNELLEAQVKVALVQVPGLNAAPIDVTHHNGVLTLEGFIEDESQRQQATRAARSVTGVESVVDKLQVK